MEEIILTRRYVSAYFAQQADPAGFDKSPMRTLVMEIEHELVAEALNAE